MADTPEELNRPTSSSELLGNLRRGGGPLALAMRASELGFVQADLSIATDESNKAIELGLPADGLREDLGRLELKEISLRDAYEAHASEENLEARDAAERSRREAYWLRFDQVQKREQEAQVESLLAVLREPLHRPPRLVAPLVVATPAPGRRARPRERGSRREHTLSGARGDPSEDDDPPRVGRPPALVIELGLEAMRPRMYAGKS